MGPVHVSISERLHRFSPPTSDLQYLSNTHTHTPQGMSLVMVPFPCYLARGLHFWLYYYPELLIVLSFSNFNVQCSMWCTCHPVQCPTRTASDTILFWTKPYLVETQYCFLSRLFLLPLSWITSDSNSSTIVVTIASLKNP
jgi:hypothetical protein